MASGPVSRPYDQVTVGSKKKAPRPTRSTELSRKQHPLTQDTNRTIKVDYADVLSVPCCRILS